MRERDVGGSVLVTRFSSAQVVRNLRGIYAADSVTFGISDQKGVIDALADGNGVRPLCLLKRSVAVSRSASSQDDGLIRGVLTEFNRDQGSKVRVVHTEDQRFVFPMRRDNIVSSRRQQRPFVELGRGHVYHSTKNNLRVS